MAKLKEDRIEVWYFLNEEDAKEHNSKKAIGHVIVVDGILKKKAGRDSIYCWTKSTTKVEE